VQFAGQGSFGLRAESVSNNYLSGSDLLNADQLALLGTLGWNAPTGAPEESTPEGQPDGSPNFFRDFASPAPFADVARLAIRTLTEAFRIPHPGFLNYRAFDEDDHAVPIPTLGLKRCRPSPAAKAEANALERVRGLVLDAIRKAFDDRELEFDEHLNRIPLRFGSAMVFVQVQKDPFCISVASPVLSKVNTDERLLNRLNGLNGRTRFVRLFVYDGTVFAAMEVPASPFVPEHVLDALQLVGSLAGDIDDTLQKQFGGRTALGGLRSKSLVH
jgi:hypothetical protein